MTLGTTKAPQGINIGQFKENEESLDFTWKWIQEQWENELQCFTVNFDNRDIKVHFPKPKVIGDGKSGFEFIHIY